MSITWEVAVAIYGAVVATGVLFLELRRWVESEARLIISVVPEAVFFNVPGADGNTYIGVTVINRGGAPTTITNLTIHSFDSWWARLRFRPNRSAVVTNPGMPGGPQVVPQELSPGQIWHGFVLHDDGLLEWMKSPHFCVAIHATHRDRPALKRVRLKPKVPLPEEEI